MGVVMRRAPYRIGDCVSIQPRRDSLAFAFVCAERAMSAESRCRGLEDVAGFEKSFVSDAATGGRPRADEISGQDLRILRDVFDLALDIEQHVRARFVLNDV